MPFRWSEYLELASELAERDEPSALRTAVSRAYYAAFGTAREHLELEGRPLDEGANIHRSVWSLFLSSDTGPRHYIGLDGSRLRAVRNTSDYDAHIPISTQDALKALRKAR